MKYLESFIKKKNKGASLLEVLLVIAIISILAASTGPFLIRFYQQNNLDTTTDKIVGTIRKAQNYSLDKKNGEVWGACLAGDKIRLFTGTCGSPSFSEDFDVPSSINITGFNEITFSPLRGEPSSALSIQISNSSGDQSVALNSGGGLDIN